MSPSLFMIILLIIALLLNVPIGFALGIASVGTIFAFDLYPANFVIQTYFSSANSFTLLAIPFFVLAGDLMLRGGISEKLTNLGRAFLGHRRSSMASITVVSSAIFAALSGSGPATTAAIGGLMVPKMKDEGYDSAFASTVACCSGVLGPLIPPSIIMAIYAVTVNVSISDMFLAGALPGIGLMVALIIWSTYMCKKYGYGEVAQKSSWKERMIALKDAFWAILAPVIILGGIYGGICTPTEAAVVACVYALIVGIFIYKKMTLKVILETLEQSCITAGTCLILMGGANLFGRILAGDRVPTMLASAILGITENKWVILLLLNLILIVVGMFMETITAVLILAPLLVSIVTPLGITTIHLGVIMITNLVIGYCTPPVGVNLYVACRLGNVGIEDMIKWLLSALASMFVVQLLFTYCAPLANFLPNLLQ